MTSLTSLTFNPLSRSFVNELEYSLLDFFSVYHFLSVCEDELFSALTQQLLCSICTCIVDSSAGRA